MVLNRYGDAMQLGELICALILNGSLGFGILLLSHQESLIIVLLGYQVQRSPDSVAAVRIDRHDVLASDLSADLHLPQLGDILSPQDLLNLFFGDRGKSELLRVS